MLMLIYKAYKTELGPNNKQITLFKKSCGVARFVYNWGLARRIELYKKEKKRTTYFKQDKELNSIKKIEFPWMYEVSNKVGQEALKNLDRAFSNFFRRLKDKSCKNKGFPKFKSKNKGLGGFKLKQSIFIKSSKIKLPKIGWVKLKEKDYIPTSGIKINSATISEKAGRWFVSVNVEEEINIPENTGPIIGIDLGLTSFITDSAGNKINAPKPLKKYLKKLKSLQGRHSKKQKGSKNREKSRIKLAKLHFKISSVRKDFLNKLSTKLTRTKSMIVIENLSIENMVKNHNLAQAISDVSWSEFVIMLEYKSKLYGSKVFKIDRFYPSTKLCSNCNHKKDEISLSERTYKCEACGLILDRDINAAKNILNYYINQNIPKVLGNFKPVETTPMGVSMKQESNLNQFSVDSVSFEERYTSSYN